MQLHAQDFAEVLDALKAAVAEAKGSEPRTIARMEVQAQVRAHPYKDGQIGHPYTCLTRDLSFNGIGLLQSTEVAVGTHVVVLLPREEAATLTVLCTVTSCRTVADGLYSVGLAFDRLLKLDASKPTANLRSAPAATPGPVVEGNPAHAPPKPGRRPAKAAAQVAATAQVAAAAQVAADAASAAEDELKRIRESILG